MKDRKYLRKMAITLYDNDFWSTLKGLVTIIADSRPAKLEDETHIEYKYRLYKVLQEGIYPMYRLRQNPYEYNRQFEENNPDHMWNYLAEGLKLYINDEVDELLDNDFDGNGEFIFIDFTLGEQSKIYQA
jgi:hypothetical protein